MGLTRKVGAVWGGGFGMGERSSLRLAEAGAQGAVIDLIAERAEKIAGEINAGDGKAVALTADITDEPSVEQALAAAVGINEVEDERVFQALEDMARGMALR